jgi:hypothetical protein
MKRALFILGLSSFWLFQGSAQACSIWSADGKTCLVEDDLVLQSKSFAVQAPSPADVVRLSPPATPPEPQSHLSQYQAPGFPEGIVREEFRRLSEEEFRAMNGGAGKNTTGVCANFDEANKRCHVYHLSVSQYERAVGAGFKAAGAGMEIMRDINQRFGMLPR